jgi:hypothetical protein
MREPSRRALERPELAAPFPVIISAFADAAASAMLDPERLTRYTVAIGSPAPTRRIGFLMERYGLEGAEQLHAHIGATRYAVPTSSSRSPCLRQLRRHHRRPGCGKTRRRPAINSPMPPSSYWPASSAARTPAARTTRANGARVDEFRARDEAARTAELLTT